MASIKISELNPLEKAEKEDLLVIVDSSENETKKIAIEDLNIGSTDVVISPEQPTGEDWKLWIDSDEAQNLGSEVVDTLDGNETNKAPSVRAVKEELNTYSTNEVRIGTYNGKPLYRKEFTGTVASAGIETIINSATTTDFIVSAKGGVIASSGHAFLIPRYSSETDYLNVLKIPSGVVRLQAGSNYAGSSYKITLEYTKTTDTATTSTLSEVTE